MKVYTIGYGGRKPQDFLDLLKANRIKAVIDVRLRPDRSSMGTYVKAKDPDKGIQGLLSRADILYFSYVELGNVFLDLDDWEARFSTLLDKAGDLLTERLFKVPVPFCLMCAEKLAERCHRKIVAEYLSAKGYEINHIE
jgi:uncharacterized protein (DUF488 family)